VFIFLEVSAKGDLLYIHMSSSDGTGTTKYKGTSPYTYIGSFADSASSFMPVDTWKYKKQDKWGTKQDESGTLEAKIRIALGYDKQQGAINQCVDHSQKATGSESMFSLLVLFTVFSCSTATWA